MNESINTAYRATIASVAALLSAWRRNLPAQRERELADFQEKGLRLGLQIHVPVDRPVISVILTGPDGGFSTLDTISIEYAGASLSIN